MKFQAVIITVLVATAAGHAMRGTNKMQPELVAHSLLSVEDEWRQQAEAFFDCNATATDVATDCSTANKAFRSSCVTVVNAVVQASSGDRSIVSEYLGDICAEPELKGWRQERCTMLAATVKKAMTDNNYDNREDFDAAKVCTSFWSVFSVEEHARIAKEKAEREAEEKRLAEEKAAADKKAAEEKAAAEKKEAEERAAAEKKAAEEKAAADKKAAEEAAAAEKRRIAEEADRKAKEAKEKAEEAAARLAVTQAEAAKVAEEAKRKAEEASAVAEEVKKHQALANKTAAEAEQEKKAMNGSVATNDTAVPTTNATTVETNYPAKTENVTVTEIAPVPKANETKNATAAPAAPKIENKTVMLNTSNTSFIQAASCAARRSGVFALLSEKAAALGPVCEEMCKEIGVYPKCQCPGFAGQPASDDDTRACIVKYCQDASNKCPNDGFVNCVAANSKVSALQWNAVMSHVSHGFESLAAAMRMSKNKK